MSFGGGSMLAAITDRIGNTVQVLQDEEGPPPRF